MPLTLKGLRQMLDTMDAPELRALVVELFGASAQNRRLLTARLEGDTSDLLAKLESELERAFGTSGRRPTLRVGEARKALNTYLKVTAPAQALDAELRYVEAGVRCLNEYRDWPENNYASLEGVWESALERVLTLRQEDIPFPRLAELVRAADGFGYGFSDQIAWLHDEFLEKLEEREV